MLPALKQRHHFLYVKKLGKSWASEFFIIQGVRQPLSDSNPPISSRLGFVATRKLGNAVIRNRAKRRMREVCRIHRMLFEEKGFDYVLIARKPLLEASFEKLETNLAWCLKHLHRTLDVSYSCYA